MTSVPWVLGFPWPWIPVTLDWIPGSPYHMTMISVTPFLMIVGHPATLNPMTHTLPVRAAPADFNKRIIFFTLIFRESPPLHTDPPGFQLEAARELTGGGGWFSNHRGPRKRRVCGHRSPVEGGVQGLGVVHCAIWASLPRCIVAVQTG